MIIAIDGPAGSGKSTTSKLVAKKLDIAHLDTGSMYRAITVYFIKNNLNLDEIDISSVMNSIKLEVLISNGEQSVLLNGDDVTSMLRSNEVSKLVSRVSSIREVRQKMVNIQREISKDRSIVIDGRDIGTVVFPDAEYKFFITASIESRAQRRFDELKDSDSNLTLCLLYTSPSPRDRQKSRMPSSA